MINVEKAKQNKISVFKIDFIQTGGIYFLFAEEYFNADKTKSIKSQYRYEPKLYMSKHNIRKQNIDGVLIHDGEERLIEFDDAYGFSSVDINKCYETEEEAINEYVKSQLSYDVVIIDKKEKYIYTISKFFDTNTDGNIKEFIDTMNNHGYELTIIKDGVKK